MLVKRTEMLQNQEKFVVLHSLGCLERFSRELYGHFQTLVGLYRLLGRLQSSPLHGRILFLFRQI